MREIKFRAWDKDKKEWLSTVNYLINLQGGLEWSFGGINQFLGKPNDNNIELMQFTGLKDKNGKEIYEGDVVKWFGWEVRAGKQIRPERIKVIESETWIADLHALWCINTGNSGGTVEVIGNLYENPELLES